MKKIIAVIAAMVVMSCAAFAQSESSGDSWVDNVRIEVDVGLGLQFILEARGAYRFPINSILAWDVGFEAGYCAPSFLWAVANSMNGDNNNELNTFITEAFASFWFWDFYMSYGLGFAINKGFGPMMIPTDFRLGWQPNFRQKDRGFLFKMELGFLPIPEPINHTTMTEDDKYAWLTGSMLTLTLGTSYKF